MSGSIILAMYILVFMPSNAYAYLDPASGNALASTVVALAGTLLYMCKNVFYKIINRQPGNAPKSLPLAAEDQTPVVFSEGKGYWTTFQPIVDELINQKIHFRYISLDMYDPGLTIDNRYMQSVLLGKNRRAFAKLAKIKAPIMLATTPNIGSSGYPMARPVRVEKLVHVFHAMANVADYRKGSLDHYDAVLMVGDHEKEFIRRVESARQVQRKELVTCGLPYLDSLNKQKQKTRKVLAETNPGRTTVLVAPSWGRKGCFAEYGVDFVEDLSRSGFSVIIRIHPHSYLFEADAVAKWQEKTAQLENVVWDMETTGVRAMQNADILISDTSSIRFDYVFLYKKPVITLEIPRENRQEFETIYLGESWTEEMSSQIGAIVTHDLLGELPEIVTRTIEDFPREHIQKLRDKYVANFGGSATAIVDYLVDTLNRMSMSPSEKAMKEELQVLRLDVNELKEKIKNCQAV